MATQDDFDEFFSGGEVSGVTLTASVTAGAPLLHRCHVSEESVLQLAPILAEVTHLERANEMTAPRMISEFSAGLIQVGTLLASARLQSDMARRDRKACAGRLALEAFPAYCAEKGIKGTEGIREAFVDSHADMQAAVEREARADAMVVQLDIIRSTLTMAISSTRSIVYGFRDSFSVGGSHV